MRATIRSASGSATEIGVRPIDALRVEPRQRLRQLLLRLLRRNPSAPRSLCSASTPAQIVDATARPARRAAACTAFGPEPLDAQQRHHARRVLLRAAPRASATLPVSSSSRILSAVLLPMPSIFCSSLRGQLAQVGRLRRDRLRRALVGAHAERLRVALVEHGQLGQLAQHVEDVLLGVGHGVDVCSLGGVARKRHAEVADPRRARGPGHPPGKLVLLDARSKLTKLELVRYYLVGRARRAGRASATGPIVLKRFVDGAEGEAFYQKRAPDKRPDVAAHRDAVLSVRAHRRGGGGRRRRRAGVDRQPRLHRAAPASGARRRSRPSRRAARRSRSRARASRWDDVRRVALEVKALLEELGLRGWPKTSGSRGMHVNVRIQPRWTFTEVRRAALALSREIERRAPTLATSKWWKEERHGVFLDYNQNAKDRTTCSAYSVRPLPDARVSTPLDWDEVADCDPADFTVLHRCRRASPRVGDPHAGMDEAAGLAEAAARAGRARRGGGPRRRALAAALPQDGGRSAARRALARAQAARLGGNAPRAPRAKDAAHRRRQLAEQGRRARRPRALEGAPPRGGRATSPSTTCWSIRCAAARRPGRASASTCATCPRPTRPPQETPDPDDDPTREWRQKWAARKETQ